MIDFARSHLPSHAAPTTPTSLTSASPTPGSTALAAPAPTTAAAPFPCAELAAHSHAATYRLLVLVREFDQRDGWGTGFKTCAHWLTWRTGIALGPAREKVRVAHALELLPLLSRMMESGEFSYSKIRALTG